MSRIEDILLQEYDGTDADTPKLLKAHHFIMDEKQTVTDRAIVFRDIANRALDANGAIDYVDDTVLINQYVKEMFDVFG